MSSNRLLAYLAAGAVVGSICGYILSSKNKRCESHCCSTASSNTETPSSHSGAKTSNASSTSVDPRESGSSSKTNPKKISTMPTASVDLAYPTGGASIASETQVDPHGRRRRQDSKYRQHRGPIIIAVAGASGSGKTSIATLLQKRLQNIRVISISSDEYYKTLSPDTDPANYNFDHPAALDLDLLSEHLEKMRSGQDIEVPVYDFKTHKRDPVAVTKVCARETDVVIVDGIFVLQNERIRNSCDITIFTVEDLDVCLARRLRRDLVERGRSVESVLTQYTRFVKTGFHSFVAPTMTLADVIIPRARDNVTAIELLARDLMRRVEESQI